LAASISPGNGILADVAPGPGGAPTGEKIAGATPPPPPAIAYDGQLAVNHHD
jgi:hypothetical protein